MVKAMKSQKIVNKETKDMKALEDMYKRIVVSPKKEKLILLKKNAAAKKVITKEKQTLLKQKAAVKKALTKEKETVLKKKAAVEKAHEAQSLAKEKKALALAKAVVQQEKKASLLVSLKKKAAAAKAAAAQKAAAEKAAAEKAEKAQPADGLVVRYVKHTKQATPKKTPKKRVQEVAVAVPEALKALPDVAKPERPTLKKPTGGGWGVFLQERRDEITKSLAGQPCTAVVKKASELYKALTEEERKPFHAKYLELFETYKAAVAEYEESCRLSGHAVETPTKKRKLDKDNVTPTKKYTPVKVSAELVGPLNEDSLREAKGLGYEDAFRNLTLKKVLVEKGVPHDKMVRALRASGGVERKAFAALQI